MRHMMRPFRSGDRLEDHAVPIGEVMQQLQTQLAEYSALKEQLGVGTGGMPGGGRFPPSQYSSVPMHATDSVDSMATSASSSFQNLRASLDTPRSFDVLSRKNS
ncbi:Adenylate cyclase [Penicillium lagena]|uniref:Adenylate cyclase n=1 Tax=Penicillium lagena TaxID=94218 RepID=UPI002540F073|nr:Adenylate cyclase [Penicillium lagena]KAJ5619641.1 Adenylate cyclase [Penicillium lagena]